MRVKNMVQKNILFGMIIGIVLKMKTDSDNKLKKDSLDIWEKHWSGTQKNQENLADVYGPSNTQIKKDK